MRSHIPGKNVIIVHQFCLGDDDVKVEAMQDTQAGWTSPNRTEVVWMLIRSPSKNRTVKGVTLKDISNFFS